MKKYTFKLVPILLLLLSMMVSCSKDKGNYDYTILDPVAIDVTGVPAAYALLRFEYLDIKPVVTYKGQVVNAANPQFPELSFSWEMYPTQAYKDIKEKYTLGNTLNLHYQMTEKEITWEVLFTVTNTNTGVKTFAKFNSTVTPALAEGWMVLYEKNGNSDVGIITNNEISKAATTEKLFLDLYEASNGSPLAGTPGSIIYTKSGFPTLVSLYIQTNKDVANVNTNTFQKIGTANKGIFWNPPATISPSFIGTIEARKDFMINNNKLHQIDYTTIAHGDRAFGDALGGTYGTLAPWIPYSLAPAFDAIVYDQTNKKFLKVVTRGAEVVPIATTQNVNSPFDVNNVGLDFVMADMGWNNWEHIVMKNNAGKFYLLTANFKEGETALIGKGKYDMSNCPEIAAINSVTAGVYGEIFYYSANNHLYQFKYTPGITDQLWTAPASETITNIALQKYMNTNRASGVLYDPKNFCKILYVATYNESTKIGSVYQMEVNVTNGAIIPGTEKKYTGFGKVKAMAWKPGIK
jgi:hypothetical protein